MSFDIFQTQRLHVALETRPLCGGVPVHIVQTNAAIRQFKSVKGALLSSSSIAQIRFISLPIVQQQQQQ